MALPDDELPGLVTETSCNLGSLDDLLADRPRPTGVTGSLGALDMYDDPEALGQETAGEEDQSTPGWDGV